MAPSKGNAPPEEHLYCIPSATSQAQPIQSQTNPIPYIIGVVVAIIAAVAIIGALIMLSHRKRP